MQRVDSVRKISTSTSALETKIIFNLLSLTAETQYGICSNMVANSLPEDTPSTLVRALLLGIFNRSKLSSAGTRRVVVSL